VNIGLGQTVTRDPMTREEKREVLASSAPKIIDEKRYYGPAVTDFADIKRRMNEQKCDGSA